VGLAGLLINSSGAISAGGSISAAGGLNVSGAGWGVLPYVANSLVIDSTAGQTRLFATGTDASTHGNLLFFTGTTNGTASERLRITSAGLVGVGTSSPNSFFHVKGGNNNVANIDNDGSQYTNLGFSNNGTEKGAIYWDNSNSAFILGPNAASSQLLFRANNAERARIDSSGRVGIGNSNPRGIIHVGADINGGATDAAAINIKQTSTTKNTGIYLERSADRRGHYIYISSTYDALTFERNNLGTSAVTMVLDRDGNVGIGTTSPSELLHVSGGLVRLEDGASGSVIRFYKSSAQTAFISNRSFGFHDGNGLALQTSTADPIRFAINDSEAVRIDSSKRLLVGTSTSYANADVDELQIGNNSSATKTGITLGSTDQSGIAFADASDARAGLIEYTHSIDSLRFYTNGASNERMRIRSDGTTLIGKTTGDDTVTGVKLGTNAGDNVFTVGSGASWALMCNRQGDDGTLILFRQANTAEGSISVSGTTVSYNGAHLSRWSQLPSGAERTEILRGSVLSNIDEMCEWGEEDNEQLNRMKVSDVEGDKNVSGVFQAWDDDDDTYVNDFYCAMTGDFIIRIAEGITVERGDLLMSAGDGTAKPQDDDIIRSKTIAKVTSTNVSCTYEDGSYCVPCVLTSSPLHY
jgi:hypothetical protein